MRVTLAAVLLAAAAVAGCKPKPPPAPPEPPPYAPPRPNQPEFASCTWGEVKGDDISFKGVGLSVWSFSCGADHANQHLVADDALPGLVLVQTGADGKEQRHVVIRAFAKDAAAPLNSILPQVQAVSPRLDSSCDFQAAPKIGPGAMTLGPTGSDKLAWEDAQKNGGADLPCGDMGVGFVGDRYFEVMPGHPEQVLFIDRGSEIQVFDPATVRLVQ